MAIQIEKRLMLKVGIKGTTKGVNTKTVTVLNINLPKYQGKENVTVRGSTVTITKYTQ